QSIYPEYLSPAVRCRYVDTVMDRILEKWRTAPALDVVDLRADLKSLKSSGTVYYRVDTHWTPRGCFAGYTQTVAALARLLPSVANRSANDFRFEPATNNFGDLWRQLGFSAAPPTEDVLYPIPRCRRARVLNEEVPLGNDPTLSHLTTAVYE